MPTRTIALKATESTTDISRSSNRVPLEALQMLTQSVSKCNPEYIQPLPFKVLSRMSAEYFEISHGGFSTYRVMRKQPFGKINLNFHILPVNSNRVIIIFFFARMRSRRSLPWLF